MEQLNNNHCSKLYQHRDDSLDSEAQLTCYSSDKFKSSFAGGMNSNQNTNQPLHHIQDSLFKPDSSQANNRQLPSHSFSIGTYKIHDCCGKSKDREESSTDQRIQRLSRDSSKKNLNKSMNKKRGSTNLESLIHQGGLNYNKSNQGHVMMMAEGFFPASTMNSTKVVKLSLGLTKTAKKDGSSNNNTQMLKDISEGPFDQDQSTGKSQEKREEFVRVFKASYYNKTPSKVFKPKTQLTASKKHSSQLFHTITKKPHHQSQIQIIDPSCDDNQAYFEDESFTELQNYLTTRQEQQQQQQNEEIQTPSLKQQISQKYQQHQVNKQNQGEILFQSPNRIYNKKEGHFQIELKKEQDKSQQKFKENRSSYVINDVKKSMSNMKKHSNTKSQINIQGTKQTPASLQNAIKFERFKKKWTNQDQQQQQQQQQQQKNTSQVKHQSKTSQNQTHNNNERQTIQPLTATVNLESNFQTLDDRKTSFDAQLSQYDKILPPYYQKKLDVNKEYQHLTISSINPLNYQATVSRSHTPTNFEQQKSSSILSSKSNLLIRDSNTSSSHSHIGITSEQPQQHTHLYTETDSDYAFHQQLRELMTPSELKKLNYPTADCYSFLKKSLSSQFNISQEFFQASDQLKKLTQTILFFLSFYKDFESILNNPKILYLQQELSKVMKQYALSKLDLDIEDMQEKANRYDNMRVQQQNEMEEINRFLVYAKKQRTEIEKKHLTNLQAEIKRLQNDNGKLQQSLRLKIRNEDFTQTTVNNLTSKKNKNLGYPYNSGSKGLGQMTRHIQELQVQIEKRTKCIEDLDSKFKHQEAEHEKYKQETLMKEKQMKQVIQELTAKFKKLKKEKDFLKQQQISGAYLDPSQYTELHLEKHRLQDKVSSLEAVNQQLVEVLNSKEKFKQIQDSFIELSSILVSKKDSKIEMSYQQQEFFKTVINESLKKDLEVKARKELQAQSVSAELLKILNEQLNWLSQNRQLSSVCIIEKSSELRNQLQNCHSKFYAIFGEVPNLMKDHFEFSQSKQLSSVQRDADHSFDNDEIELIVNSVEPFRYNLQSKPFQKRSFSNKSSTVCKSFSSKTQNALLYQNNVLSTIHNQDIVKDESSSTMIGTNSGCINPDRNVISLLFNPLPSKKDTTLNQNYKINSNMMDLSPQSTLNFNQEAHSSAATSRVRRTTTKGAVVLTKKELKARINLLKKENKEIRALLEKLYLQMQGNQTIGFSLKTPLRLSPLREKSLSRKDFKHAYPSLLLSEEEEVMLQFEQHNYTEFQGVDLLKSLHSMANLLEESIRIQPI